MTSFYISGTRGGTGKSTVATNLVVWLASSGRKVLLVDADQTGAATVWCQLRANAGIVPAIPLAKMKGSIGKKIRKLAADFDDVVVDMAGFNSVELHSALEVADVLIAPARAGYWDFHALAGLNETIREIRASSNPHLRALIVLNGMSPNSRAKDEPTQRASVSRLTEFVCLEKFIRLRSCFMHSIPHGRSVMEYKPHNRKAIEDIDAVFKEIMTYATT